MSLNKKQIVIACIVGVLSYICFLMSEGIIRDYDKEKIDGLRKEYYNARITPYKYSRDFKLKEYEFMAEAEMRYPYGKDTAATKILFVKFPGQYYKYKYTIIFFLLVVGGMLMYSLRDK